MMVEHHGDSTRKLKTAAGSANPAITPNPRLTPQQEDNLAQLRAANGKDFDTLYRTQQITAHQQTLASLEGYQASDDVQVLKDWAAQISPIVRGHLNRIHGM
jgi:putative membrane protein